MKIKAYIVTTDNMNYPDAPNYSKEFEVHTIEDIVSHVESELHTFKGIYPDGIRIFAYDSDNEDSFEATIFEYETEKKYEKLTDVMDKLISEIREINLKNIFNRN